MQTSAPLSYTLDDWSRGWDNLSAAASVAKNALVVAKNCNLIGNTAGEEPKMSVEKRSGSALLYPTAAQTGPVHSIFEYQAPASTLVLIGADNTGVDSRLSAYYTAAWHDLKTGLTLTKKLSFTVHQGMCYCVNGVDANFKLYNTTAYALGMLVPTVAPTVADGGAGVLLNGAQYYYKYCYRRSSAVFNQLTGNPSPISLIYTEAGGGARYNHVSVTQSPADAQIDKIVIYRTVDVSSGGDTTKFFFVAEVANTTGAYNDNVADAALGALMEIDNTIPPKSKFITLFADSVFYANCPAETDGTSLVMFSKPGSGEAVPSVNYFYFDRKDGKEITGICAIGGYLVVFKQNKIGVVPEDFSSLNIISFGIGCVAPWAIIPFADRCIFLSEEGWKVFDGSNIYDITGLIGNLMNEGYVSYIEAEHYSAAYYPARHQFHYLVNHTDSSKRRVLVGHFLTPLLYLEKGIGEQPSSNLVAWTYHIYGNKIFTVMGTYTDTLGIQRLVAGTSDGFVYLWDYGLDDAATGQAPAVNIDWEMETGWLNLDLPVSLTKTLRRLYLQYTTSETGTIEAGVTADYLEPIIDYFYGVDACFSGYCYAGYAYLAVDGNVLDGQPLSNKGQIFKLNLKSSSAQGIIVNSATFHYRREVLR